MFCELTSLLLLSPSTSSFKTARQSPSGPRQVAPYIVRLLNGASANGSALARPVPPQAYNALLPSVWALANANLANNMMDEDSDVLQATLQHALRISSSSATKRASVEFVGRLVLLDTERQYHGDLRLSMQPGALRSLIEEWVLHLPKTLWEVVARDPSMSEVIIRLLLRLAQRRARCLTPEVGHDYHLLAWSIH
jgi:pre-rRNA-processing protein IPI1